MRLPEPLIPATLLRRYKRFLADVELASGEAVTVHCANSGSMLGLDAPGSQVLLSRSDNRRRKLAYTWELVRVADTWVGVNTLVPNRVVHEALRLQQIPALQPYDEIKPEATAGGRSRFDFLLRDRQRRCFVEVKSVTLAQAEVALFPDAKTERGSKHLRELSELARDGARAVMFFLVNRGDCTRFAPAE
ncbi:MAG: DNA/RNA nuclease SfsA, partial [bacterium]